MPWLIQRIQCCLNQYACVFLQPKRLVHTGQSLLQRSLCDNTPVVHHYNVVGQARHFAGGVGNVDYRNGQMVAQPLKVGQYLLL